MEIQISHGSKLAHSANTERLHISYHVAAGHIDEDLLRRILAEILTCTYDSDEELKLDIFNAISVDDVFY